MDEVKEQARFLNNDTNWRVRAHAAWRLGKLGDPEAARALCRALRDSRQEVRAAATLALVQTGGPAVEPLCHALEDGDWLVRWQAARALGRIGDARALPALRARLHRFAGGADAVVHSQIVMAIRQIRRATAGTRGMPRAAEGEAPLPAGRPRADEAASEARLPEG